MKNNQVTLEEILEQREKRTYFLAQTKNDFPNHTIISFKLNVPGPKKNDKELLFAFEEGLKHLHNTEITHDWRKAKTGPEAILITKNDLKKVKSEMIKIENKHPLGRLYDLDVVGVDRSLLNIEPRKCLICNDIAHACSRSRKHGLDEVLDKIYSMISDFQGIRYDSNQ